MTTQQTPTMTPASPAFPASVVTAPPGEILVTPGRHRRPGAWPR